MSPAEDERLRSRTIVSGTFPEVDNVRDAGNLVHDGSLHELLSEAAKGLVGAALATVDASGNVRCATVGVRSVAQSDPVDDETLFVIGSITKLATAAVVCQLAGEGRIGLDLPIGAWLPEIGAIDGAASITVRHLLCHSAGLVDLWEPAENLEAMSGRLASYGLLAPPGKQLSYSNPGYVFLGALIENVTGRSWARNIRQRLIEPLGLKRVLLGDEAGEPANIARDHLVNTTTAHPYLGETWPKIGQTYAAAGSTGKASIVDAARLGAALLFGRSRAGEQAILSPDELKEMQRIHIPMPGTNPSGAGWGLGWSIFDDSESVGHQGGTTGYMVGNRQHGKLAVFLSNTSNGWREGRSLAPRLVGLPSPAAVRPSKARPGPELAGRYSSPTMSVQVHRGPHGLTLIDPIDGADVPLMPLGDDAFLGSIGGGSTEVIFLRRSDGSAPTHLHLFSRALPRDVSPRLEQRPRSSL